ncbi:type II toxin-antitoxin system Phd/YefM family antitoxin [Staphylococcus rostri]|uniref:Antitoxin n=1 Tax=Staphylococcus rostri TaxID=522262 RepID=A0A2K3YRT6_9STAP|nr:type II toxin-antitoxin system Phd/YefM family antitoxin [Staphylococcus rostri]PNZ27938.1 hypothetical protein CD122_05665 [Staphylococcus rostri]
MKTVTVKYASKNLETLINQANENQDVVMIKGNPHSGVLMSEREYHAIMIKLGMKH